jgi:hypothetical protein
MGRELVEKHLAQAEQHVTRGDHILAQQREIIARLRNGGLDTTEARKLLATFEETQAINISDRDRLRQELIEHSKVVQNHEG